MKWGGGYDIRNIEDISQLDELDGDKEKIEKIGMYE